MKNILLKKCINCFFKKRLACSLSTASVFCLTMFNAPAVFAKTSLIKNITNTIEWRGNTGADVRAFTERQKVQGSAFAEVEMHWQSEKSNNSFTATIFGRTDTLDNERSHADIREFMWLYYTDTWELRAGVGKVFWGVTESAHRVDIINQTDGVEAADGEAKLGQPMINWSGIYSWGTLDAFILPYFRERTFAGPKSPLSFHLPHLSLQNVNTKNQGLPIGEANYESRKKQKNIDYALRYFHTVDIWDLGLSYFKGTNRNPLLTPKTNEDTQTLVPFYQQIEQTGLSVQATLNSWLWKLEAIHQKNTLKDFAAVTAGFEYTWVGMANSAKDLGLLAEWHHDSRNERADDPLQNDLFLGARLTFNNIEDTALLAGVIQDLTYSDSRLAFVEASRRIGQNWTIRLDGRAYLSKTPTDLVNALRKADHVTFEMVYHF